MPHGTAPPAADVAWGDTLAGDMAGVMCATLADDVSRATVDADMAPHYSATCHMSPKAMQIHHRSHDQFFTNFVKSLLA